MLGSQQLPRRINSAQSPHISQPCFRTSGQSAVTSTPFIRWHAPPFAHGLLSLNARTGKNFRDTTFGHTLLGKRHGSSGRWLDRQSRDKFAREAKVQGLKSRAAFKLLQINEKYRLFRPGQTVVDLGYAPGSWSQVAVDMVKPSGRVIGVDIIPAQPPKGVSTIQGNFLSPDVQASIKSLLSDSARGRMPLPKRSINGGAEDTSQLEVDAAMTRGYIDHERHATLSKPKRQDSAKVAKTVDVVLSDMCEPWDQTEGFYKRTLSDPYLRMMNTSGNNFRDHIGSMDLCRSALQFSLETLRKGGHFVCKFYQGSEDKAFEDLLKTVFSKIHREKPESSRSESREAYFVALKRQTHRQEMAASDEG